MYLERRAQAAVCVLASRRGISKLRVSSVETTSLGKSFRFPIKLFLKDYPLFDVDVVVVDVVFAPSAIPAPARGYLGLLRGFRPALL